MLRLQIHTTFIIVNKKNYILNAKFINLNAGGAITRAMVSHKQSHYNVIYRGAPAERSLLASGLAHDVGIPDRHIQVSHRLRVFQIRRGKCFADLSSAGMFY